MNLKTATILMQVIWIVHCRLSVCTKAGRAVGGAPVSQNVSRRQCSCRCQERPVCHRLSVHCNAGVITQHIPPWGFFKRWCPIHMNLFLSFVQPLDGNLEWSLLTLTIRHSQAREPANSPMSPITPAVQWRARAIP